MINMDEKELLKLIEKGETQKMEFKESLGLKDEIGEVVSAFSNTNPGRILIGVRDTGEVVGVQVGKKTVQELANYIKTHTDNHIFPEISVEEIEDKKIVVIDVKESPEKSVFFKSKAFRRVGDSTHKLSASEIRKLAKESGPRMYWDEQICEASLEDIDEEKVRWFLKEAKRQRGLDMSENVPTEEALMRLKLLKNKKLTNAVVLLFGKEPQKFFTRPEVKCIRFKGTDVTGKMLDFKVIKANLFDQLIETERFIYNNISMAAWIEEGKLQRQEKWEYPPKAIREALANALCHRVYETSSSVQVRIFDDRIEFWNPGKLPEGWTVETLKQKHESKPPNPSLIQHFFWVKYVEEVGTGTNKIIKWCKEWNLLEPDFEFTGTSLIVTFKKPPVLKDLEKLGLNERQIKAVNYVAKKGSIANKEYQEVNDVARTTATEDLSDLVKRGVFIRVGKGKRGLKYILVLHKKSAKNVQKNVQKRK